MRVYFFGSKNEEKISHYYLKILESLKKTGVSIVSNLKDEKAKEFTSRELEKVDPSGGLPLDKMDCLVIEGSYPNSEIGYLVAFAISRKKPILFLMEKGKALDSTLRNINKNKETARFLKVQYYTSYSIEKMIPYFLRAIENYEENAVPTIKFTLRINPVMDRYLTWKTKDSKQTKADFLRKKIMDEIIKKDSEYQRYLKRGEIKFL